MASPPCDSEGGLPVCNGHQKVAAVLDSPPIYRHTVVMSVCGRAPDGRPDVVGRRIAGHIVPTGILGPLSLCPLPPYCHRVWKRRRRRRKTKEGFLG